MIVMLCISCCSVVVFSLPLLTQLFQYYRHNCSNAVVTTVSQPWNKCDFSFGTSVTTVVEQLFQYLLNNCFNGDGHDLKTFYILVVKIAAVIAITLEEISYYCLLFFRDEFLASHAAIIAGSPTEDSHNS